MTAAIVGVAESDLGQTGRSILGLQAQAVRRALDDCGLNLRDIDGLAPDEDTLLDVSGVPAGITRR